MPKREGRVRLAASVAFALVAGATPGAVTMVVAQESGQPELAKLVPGDRLQMRPEDIDIEALTLKSDFTVFMNRSRCSEEQRLKALRKLWTLLPVEPVLENLAF